MFDWMKIEPKVRMSVVEASDVPVSVRRQSMKRKIQNRLLRVTLFADWCYYLMK